MSRWDLWRWLGLFALACVIAGILIVAIADQTTGVDHPAPPIYSQCVGNDHRSDICLGA